MEKINQSAFLIFGVLMALGIASGGYFIGQTMYNAKVAVNTASVKGSAERRVQADRANWKISFSGVAATRAGVASLYKGGEADQTKIIKLLKDNGFSDEEIKIGIIDGAIPLSR